MMWRAAVSLATVLFCGYASAANGIEGPVSGYVFDAARGQLLPINGRPGGATLGAPVELPGPVRQAAIAAEGFALAVDADGQVLLISSLHGQQATVTRLASANTYPDHIFLNGGRMAALYGRAQKTAQLVTGLPDNPTVSSPIDLSLVPGDVLAIAADPTGSYLLVGAGSQGAGGIYRVSTDGKSTAVPLLAPAISPVAIRFVHAGRDAAVLDQGADQLFLLENVLGTAEERLLAGAMDGLRAPAQLAAGRDGSYFLVGSMGETRLRLIRMQGNFAASVETVDLPAVPTRLTELTTDLYLLSAGDKPGVLWSVLDASQTPKAYFIPAVPRASRAAGRRPLK